MWLWLALAAHGADSERHHERFAASRAAESALRFEEAIDACAGAVDAWPDGPRAPSCERRIATLERRRDPDGTFRGYRTLQSVRNRFRNADADALRNEVRELVSSASLSEVVRGEAEIWLARDALDRLDDAEQALPYTESAFGRLAAFVDDEAVRRQAIELHAVTLARMGRAEEAIQVEAMIRIETAAPRSTPVEQVLDERWRTGAAVASGLVTGLFAILGLPLAAFGWIERPVPLPMGLIAVTVALATATILVAGWTLEAAAALPAVFCGGAAIHLVAAGALQATRDRPWTQRGLRMLAAFATVGVGYLALYFTHTLHWVRL